jgi:hypothetical protein
VTLDTPPWYYRWFYRMPGIHQMRKTTLAFCGIQPIKTLLFGPVLGSTPAQRSTWLKQAGALVEKGSFHVHRHSRDYRARPSRRFVTMKPSVCCPCPSARDNTGFIRNRALSG